MSSSMVIPGPSAPAKDAITRLQYLLKNSLANFAEAMQKTAAVDAPLTEAQFNALSLGNIEETDERGTNPLILKSELLEMARREGEILSLAVDEIDLLPVSTTTQEERYRQIRILDELNENAATELQELTDMANEVYSEIRSNLRRVVELSQHEEATNNHS